MMISGSPISSHLPEDLGLGERFWYWRGVSGRKYIHSIYAVDACPPLPGAVYVAVRNGARGREALAVGRFPAYWEGGFDANRILGPAASVADEIHVHLLARDDWAADSVLHDLEMADSASAPDVPCMAAVATAPQLSLAFS